MAAEPTTRSRASAPLGGALRAESSEGVLRVIFSGEWKRELLRPDFFQERDEALREAERLLKEASPESATSRLMTPASPKASAT